MRKTLTAFAFTAAIATGSLLQAQDTQFPWRTDAGVQPVVHPDMQRSHARIVLPKQSAAPLTLRASAPQLPVQATQPQIAQRQILPPQPVQPLSRPPSATQSQLVAQPQPVAQPQFVAQPQSESLQLPQRIAQPQVPQPLVSQTLMPQTSMSQTSMPQFQNKASTAVEIERQRLEAIRAAQLKMRGIHFDNESASSTPRPKPYLVSFSNQQEQDLADAQPSVSDAAKSNQEVVPPQAALPAYAPMNQSTVDLGREPVVVQPPTTAPEQASVPLSVASNAMEEPDYCQRNCKRDWCNLGCERKLFGTSPRGLEIGGWANLGYHNRDNIMLNNRKAEANLHQAWLYFDKAASRDCPTWDFGFHVDMLYGVDGQDLQAFGNPPAGVPEGWDNSWDYGSYGWALPQAYVQFANDRWDVKLGKFFSPFGYEVIAAPENFFYSHSYTMFYTEPFTMSGGLAERQVNDNWSFLIGATAGWDTGFDNDTGGCLITGHRIQLNEDVNLALTTCWGDRGRRGVGGLTTAVADVQLTETVNYVFQSDWLDFGTNQEFGIVQYLFRDVTDCLALGGRLEWWKSDQLYTDTKSTYEFTMGANVRPNANITLRPEVRWDWGAAAIDPGTTIFGLDIVATY